MTFEFFKGGIKIDGIPYAYIYFYNMYAPHRMFRRWLSRKVFYWADRKYGEGKDTKKWHFWMRIKNKINNAIGRRR